MKEKQYILFSLKNNDFIFLKSNSLEEILRYANEISKLQENKQNIFAVLNDLQNVLEVKENHRKWDFPVKLLNIVIKDYGLEII